ncbi:MAG: hypothetical protein ACI9EZ_001019 [Halobacteriales archaeon]|jgi:hypothetical protein
MTTFRAARSPLTGNPVVSIAPTDGHRKLPSDTMSETVGVEEPSRSLSPAGCHPTAEQTFRLDYDGG